MLQINSGKLFTRGVGTTNFLRGVIYSNLRLPWRTEKIQTDAGTLLATDGRRDNRAIVFEMEEKIEEGENGPNVLVSRTVAPYLNDFATVASFYFNVVMSSDVDLVSRLIGGRAGFDSFGPNKEFVTRFFDDYVYPSDVEIESFPQFVRQLLALDRKTFLASMRSMKSFVAGHHRIGDDLGLAYALIVASVESLAQGFDGHETVWEDVEDRLRNGIDSALASADPNICSAVKEAIIRNEDTRLSRRFKAFVQNHLSPEFFREAATGNYPIARSELPEVLTQAYRLRSKYIHTIRELPDALTHPNKYFETTRDDGKPLLTFQGLARIARHVIVNFVWRGRTVDNEPYPYVSESAGVATFPLAAECWIWQPLPDLSHSRRYLRGFLEQLTSVLARENDAKLTDLKAMLDGGAALLPHARPTDRAAFLAILALYNFQVHPDHQSKDFQILLDRYGADSDLPLSENLVAHTLLNSTNVWDLDKHIELHAAHVSDSGKGKGLILPRRLDAAVTLVLAERCRLADRVETARKLVEHAVENIPGNAGVLALEQNFASNNEIKFWQVLFPPLNPDGGEPTKEEPVA
jgi:hypothetical protein